MRHIHSQIYISSSKIIAYLALGVIAGSIVGFFIGYSMSGFRTDTESQSQVAKLRSQISSLESQLASKEYEISTLKTNISRLERTIEKLRSMLDDRNRQIKDLRDQLSDREQLIRQYEEQLISLKNQTTFLWQEINRIANTNRIVQSEEYLLNMTGVLRAVPEFPKKTIELRSTYFTTLGRQIKAEITLRAEPLVKADIDISIRVCYSIAGNPVEIYSQWLGFEEWEFYLHPQLSLTLYLPLDKIPQSYFGKVPIFIELYVAALPWSSPTYLFIELTAYDVYPP